MPAFRAFVLRRNEPEADALAVQMMARLGFDPASLVNYLTRLPGLENRDGRIQAINESHTKLPAASYLASTNEFPAIRQQVIEASKPAQATWDPPTLRRTK
jgi:predicted Zn-dependent protease